MSKGPQTVRLQRRTAMIYGAMASLGVIFALAGTPAIQAFGLGLILPGGGFAALAAPASFLLIVLSLVLFVVAIFLWFATGNVIAPPLVWFGAAFSAAGMATDPVSHAALLAIPVLPLIAFALIAIAPGKKSAPAPIPFVAASPALPAV